MAKRRDRRDVVLDVFARIDWFDLIKDRRGGWHAVIDGRVELTRRERRAIDRVMGPRFEAERAAYEAEMKDLPTPAPSARPGYASKEMEEWATSERENRIRSWPQPLHRTYR